MPKLIGHIEKIDDPGDNVPEQKQTVPDKEIEDDTTTEEQKLPVGPRRRKTQSIAKAKQAALDAKIREQTRRWDEATKWRRATNEVLGDMDLEEAMEKTTGVEAASTSMASTAIPRTVMA